MWIYKEKEINGHVDLHPRCTDFVYLVTDQDGRQYIGKKTIRSIRKKPPLKGKKRARRVMTDLPFMDYAGSHTKECGEIVEKEILYQCSTKKAATYLETALLFHHDAIFDPHFLNTNISGRFFPNDLSGNLEDE